MATRSAQGAVQSTLWPELLSWDAWLSNKMFIPLCLQAERAEALQVFTAFVVTAQREQMQKQAAKKASAGHFKVCDALCTVASHCWAAAEGINSVHKKIGCAGSCNPRQRSSQLSRSSVLKHSWQPKTKRSLHCFAGLWQFQLGSAAEGYWTGGHRSGTDYSAF